MITLRHRHVWQSVIASPAALPTPPRHVTTSMIEARFVSFLRVWQCLGDVVKLSEAFLLVEEEEEIGRGTLGKAK